MFTLAFLKGRELRRLRSRLSRFRKRMMLRAGEHADAGRTQLELFCLSEATRARIAIDEIDGVLHG